MTARIPKFLQNDSPADTALKLSARLWFAVFVLGLWIFLYYIMGRYGGPVLQEGIAGWNKVAVPHHTNEPTFTTMESIALATHLTLSFIIFVGGPLQLFLGAIINGDWPFQPKSQIQHRARPLHRWTGRLYIPAILLTSIAGLYLTWSPGIPEEYGTGIFAILYIIFAGNSIFAGLGIIFAVIALRYAMAGDITRHRRFALRLFVVAGTAFFFRIQLALWLQMGGEISESLITIMGYTQSLLPLAILELYLLTQDRAGARGKYAMAAVLLVMTALMAMGIYAAKGMYF